MQPSPRSTLSFHTRSQTAIFSSTPAATQNRDRVADRSSIELGATLQAIHRLSPHVSKKERVPALVKQLRKDLVREMKRTVKKMPARTIANCIFNMASLKLADKALMAKTVDAVGSKCVAARLLTPSASCVRRGPVLCHSATLAVGMQDGTKTVSRRGLQSPGKKGTNVRQK